MFVPEVRLVFLESAGFNVGAKVIELLRPLVGQLDDEKEDAAEDRDPHVNPVGRQSAHFERGPREHDRDRRSDQDSGIHRSDRHVEEAVWPVTGLGIKSQEDVGGEKSPEEHDFRGEKKPDTDLGIPKAGVGTGGNCVRYFHS